MCTLAMKTSYYSEIDVEVEKSTDSPLYSFIAGKAAQNERKKNSRIPLAVFHPKCRAPYQPTVAELLVISHNFATSQPPETVQYPQQGLPTIGGTLSFF